VAYTLSLDFATQTVNKRQGMEENKMKTVFMFPGQSSRYPQMFDKLVSMAPQNQIILEQASSILGRNLGQHYSNDNPATIFATNRDVQIGVFLANHMSLQILQDRGIEADLSLGLSLGEWNHLVHIGALTFEQALPAIEERGLAYDAGPRGAMASFFPVSIEELQPIVEQARSFGLLEIVNLNSPRQYVLAGEMTALQEAIRLADDELYIEGVIIERQVPMHASVFGSVGQRFRKCLQKLPFVQPKKPYIPNRLAKLINSPTSETFIDLLATHVHHPVLWRASIDMLMEQFEDLVFVEVGVKAVLHNLFDRKWHKGVKKFKTDSRENSVQHLQEVVESLQKLQHPVIYETPTKASISKKSSTASTPTNSSTPNGEVGATG
jgi:[acyl-carrier-protein] S-malonyltransferase